MILYDMYTEKKSSHPCVPKYIENTLIKTGFLKASKEEENQLNAWKITNPFMDTVTTPTSAGLQEKT